MNVLLVSYTFPPFGGVGVQRALSFARYLPRHGCSVFVVTARNAATAVRDPGLTAAIPPDVTVCRTFTPELPYALRNKIWARLAPPRTPSQAVQLGTGADRTSSPRAAVARQIQRLVSPDPQRVWVPFAMRAASRVIQANGVDTVLLTVPPYSVLFLARGLRERFPHLRIITDFRDEWLGYYLSSDKNATPAKRDEAVRLEQEAVSASDFVVSVTPSWVRQIRARYPQAGEEKFICVPNGYDPESFRDFTPRPHGTGRVVITYMGTVYANPVYSPRLLLQTIDQLPEDLRSRFELRFIGRVVDEEIPYMEASRAVVRRYGFMPQSEAFRHLEESDYLLLVVNYPYAHAGKLFEYMATGKPILALTPPDGEVARVLRETGAGWCIDPADNAGMKRILEEIARGTAPPLARNVDAVRSYERPRLVSRLIELTGMCGGA